MPINFNIVLCTCCSASPCWFLDFVFATKQRLACVLANRNAQSICGECEHKIILRMFGMQLPARFFSSSSSNALRRTVKKHIHPNREEICECKNSMLIWIPFHFDLNVCAARDDHRNDHANFVHVSRGSCKRRVKRKHAI